MQSYSPIMLFAYNRPEHILNSLNALSLCKEASESELIVIVDSPANPKDNDLVSKNKNVISYVTSFKWPGEKKIIINDKNLGIDQSIYTHVSNQLKKSETLIVLEDDLIPAENFLTYMNECLKLYKDDNTIYSINGFMFPLETKKNSLMLLPFTSSWGWATWNDRWEHFKFTGLKRENITLSDLEKQKFNLPGLDYSKMLNEYKECWDINWYYFVFTRRGLNVFPTKSMIFNAGFDGSGVHCTTEQYKQNFSSKNIIDTQKVYQQDNQLTELYFNYFRKLEQNANSSFIAKLLRKLGFKN